MGNRVYSLQEDVLREAEITTTPEQRAALLQEYDEYCTAIRRQDSYGQWTRLDEQGFWQTVEEQFCKKHGITTEDLVLAFEEERPA